MSDCSICRNYGKTMVCGECSEGSEYEPEVNTMELTEREFRAVLAFTKATKLDQEVDIVMHDNRECCFVDYSENERISFKDGINIVYDAIAYPLVHDIDLESANALFDVLVKAGLYEEKYREHIVSGDTSEIVKMINENSNVSITNGDGVCNTYSVSEAFNILSSLVKLDKSIEAEEALDVIKKAIGGGLCLTE